MSAETLRLDRLDRQLVHALVVDGRAPFNRLAAVLGTSEQTVARRYRRLREARALRVVVLPNPDRFDQSWLVRARVQPPAAVGFARAVARRQDVAWVGLTAGGAEVTFAVRTHTTSERDALLLDRLPRSRSVIGVEAASMLHRFAPGPEAEWHALEDALADHQRAALLAPEEAVGGAELTGADGPLVAVLAEDGRRSYAAIAGETGETEARVARRVDALLASQALVVDVEIDSALLGFPLSAWLWLRVAPGELAATGREIAAHPEVPFAAAMSGRANLVATVTVRDTAALYAYVTDRIGALDAAADLEIAPILRRFKQAGTLVEDDRLPEPF